VKRSRTKTLILSAVLLLASSALSAAGEVTALVRVRLGKGLDQRALVERGVDILAVRPDGLADLAVTDEQLAWISSFGIGATVLERASLAAPAEIDANLGAYYTYAEMQASLDSLAARFPVCARIDTIGTSLEGRLIRAIKISDNAAVDEDEPEIFIFGCLHARELMSVDVPMRLATYLLENCEDPRVAAIVDNREIWIAPMINPDGHVYVQANHGGASYTWWRKNRRLNGDGSYGVDLNRNFGYQWGYDNVGSSPTPSSLVYRGTAPFSEPETRAVRDFCASREFTMNLSYHSYGELILYPWDYAALFTEDQDLFAALGDSLASGNGYLPGNPATGAIYFTNGGSDDWMYGEVAAKNRIYSFTIELNTYEEGGFAPPESLILPTFNKVLDLNLRLLEYADNPHRVLGPREPVMNEIAELNPPAYEISWRPYEGPDPNPAVSYELVEYRNLRGVADSCEAGDTLWTPKGFVLSTARAHAGLSSWYSGRGDGMHNTLAMTTVYPGWYPATLGCWVWYNIESNWDYAYLETSADQGTTWKTAPGNRTTNYDPNGANRGNGITGSSGGWAYATFDLSEALLEGIGFILIRFAYETDVSVNNEGFYVDLIDPTVTFDARAVLAGALAETSYHRWPTELGTYLYQVRGIDAEGDRGRWSDFASHVVDDLSGTLPQPPAASSLAQNWPNPFNPSTTISFTVGAEEAGGLGAAPVRLALYDIAGRLVAVLVDRSMAPGAHTAVWNGRAAGGRPVAAGVYVARLEVGGKSFARKLVLVR
jgi:hypothetical protein